MRNLVLYGTTYGYTESCAKELANRLEGSTDCVDIKNAGPLDLDSYHTVVIGSSVYMGRMNKGITEVLQNSTEILKKKRLAFFVCCGFLDMAEDHFKNNIPVELLESAISKECFGGKMDISKMKFIHKLITKLVTKAGEKEGRKEPEPLPMNIEKMAKALNENFKTA